MSDADPSTAPHRLPAVDVLRAAGAAGVVAVHVGFNTAALYDGAWGGVLARLDVGVALFFVLSGFLLFRPFAQARALGTRRPGVRGYLWRRALRILPAYWVAMTASLLILPQNANSTAADWVNYATLTHIYVSPPNVRFGLNQIWSLATEVAFYVVLPLVAILALGRRWRPVRTAVVAGGLCVLATTGWLVAMGTGELPSSPYTNWLPTYAVWFGTGMVLATAHVALRTGTAPVRWQVLDRLAMAPLACWAAALGLLWVVGTPVGGGRDFLSFSVPGLASRLVLFIAIAALILIPAAFGPPTRTQRVMSAPVFQWLGAVSYGLFLWHPFVLEVIYLAENRPLFSGGLLETFLWTFGLSLILASASYYLIERPVLALGRVRRRRRQPQSGDREQPEQLRPAGDVADREVAEQLRAPLDVQGGPAGQAEQPDREPTVQPA